MPDAPVPNLFVGKNLPFPEDDLGTSAVYARHLVEFFLSCTGLSINGCQRSLHVFNQHLYWQNIVEFYQKVAAS